MQPTSEKSEKPGTLLGSFVCFEQLSLRGSVGRSTTHSMTTNAVGLCNSFAKI
jgi:hypothetical protein